MNDATSVPRSRGNCTANGNHQQPENAVKVVTATGASNSQKVGVLRREEKMACSTCSQKKAHSYTFKHSKPNYVSNNCGVDVLQNKACKYGNNWRQWTGDIQVRDTKIIRLVT